MRLRKADDQVRALFLGSPARVVKPDDAPAKNSFSHPNEFFFPFYVEQQALCSNEMIFHAFSLSNLFTTFFSPMQIECDRPEAFASSIFMFASIMFGVKFKFWFRVS